MNAATELCMETGAILKAHKLNTKVTHSICVAREDETSKFVVLTPCGVCQERLFYWGENVKAAITNADGELVFKSLKEIQPYHWYKAYNNKVKDITKNVMSFLASSIRLSIVSFIHGILRCLITIDIAKWF